MQGRKLRKAPSPDTVKERSTGAEQFLGKLVSVKIDRPLGSKHPTWGFTYDLNYGYMPGSRSRDGEEIDAYVLGVSRPLRGFTGRCVAIIRRLDDDEDKLVLAPEGQDYTEEQIKASTEFQERFFRSVIIERKTA
ncbi:MAG: inorganic pyrophosphatase [Candidatus Bathyarchaeia archaeon]